MYRAKWIVVAMVSLLGIESAMADTVTLTPVKDNTIFSRNDEASNALGILFTSTNGQGNIRRALLAFDVAGHIPAGSIVTSARLTLTLSQAASGSGVLDHGLHRLLQGWGEGNSQSSGGNGAPASPGDATWAARYFPDLLWLTAGGDFLTLPSASTPVGETPGPVTWGSTPGLVADVQSWLDSPEDSHGWIVLGNEEVLGTARKFINRENPDPALRPALTVEFTSPPAPDAAFFHVTKVFSDGREDEVTVTLTCNSGLPLQQSFSISGGGAGVHFVVEHVQGADANCLVTEAGGPTGYQPIFNDGDGCSWEGVTGGQFTCEIRNEAEPAAFTVGKQWVIDGAILEDVQLEAAVSVFCDSEISGGFFNGTEHQFDGVLSGDGASLEVAVETSGGAAECRAVENDIQSSVASSDDCGPRFIPAGGSSSCTIVNTVFFEDIPTLGELGLAILAILVLGIGLVGRRGFA
jgi:hypothetical protein